MKKICLIIIVVFFAIFLSGCIKITSISNANKVVIKEHGNNGEIIAEVCVDSIDDVKYIVDNLESLRLKNFTQGKPTGLSYSLIFYQDEKELDNIGITWQSWIVYKTNYRNSYIFMIKSGSLDLEKIKELLKQE